MIKIRFNLKPGPEFMKWQVKFADGSIKFYEPDKFQFAFSNAKLVNRKTISEKIFNGSYKTVCAWIEVERILIIESSKYIVTIDDPNLKEVKYNPKKCTHWTNEFLEDLDGQKFFGGYTKGKSVFVNTFYKMVDNEI